MSELEATALDVRMTARADADNLPPDHPIRAHAEAFKVAANGFYSEPQTVLVAKFLGVYARTRKAWCEYSGEPLV